MLFDRLRRNSARNDRPTEYVDHVYEGEVVDEKPRYIPKDVEREYSGLINLMDLASKVGTAEGTLLGDTLVPDVKPSDSVGLNTVRSVLAKPDLEFHRITHKSATESFSHTTIRTPSGMTTETHYTRYDLGGGLGGFGAGYYSALF